MATPQHLVDVFLYFFEACAHSLLHARGVYPASFFEPRAIYAVLSAPMLRHPELCDGIGALLSSLRPLLLRNVVECVLLVLLDPAGRALEQYAFAVDTNAGGGGGGGGGATQAEAESQLGAALLMLQQRARARAPLPPDCTFTVQLRTHGPLEGLPVGLPLWACVAPGDAGALGGGAAGGSSDGGGGGGGSAAGAGAAAATLRRRPLKAVQLGPLAMEIFVEEELPG